MLYYNGELYYLPSEAIFVYESCLGESFVTEREAYAKERFNAQIETRNGFSGNSYAIPTMDDLTNPIPLEDIHKSIVRFTDFVLANKNLIFYIDRIGLVAGYVTEQIAPMFLMLKESYNVYVHKDFYDILFKGRSPLLDGGELIV